jgi:hypothetical protein
MGIVFICPVNGVPAIASQENAGGKAEKSNDLFLAMHG